MDPSGAAAATNGVAPSAAAAATPAAAAAAGAAAPAGAPAPAVGDLARLQRRVTDAPQDFDAHVSLVAETEKQKQPAAIRSAIRALLAQFPLCFGYWQRLAKMEMALGAPAAAAGAAAGAAAPDAAADSVTPAEAQSNAFAVLEEGLRAVPHSHELWTYYVQEMVKSPLCTPDEIRSVFVRGSSVLSTDATASSFWDKYIEFELVQFASPAVQETLQVLPPPYTGTLIGGLYAMVLSLPLRDLERFWHSYTQKFAAMYPLNYLCSPEEAAQLTAAYPSAVPADRQTYVGADGQTVTTSLSEYAHSWEAEQRRLLLSKREYAFRVAMQLRDEKSLFESAIQRPYYHVAPLTAPELQNWHAYLDHMESKLQRQFATAHPPTADGVAADLSADTLEPLLLADVLKLYERCVIPCAKYGEFWERYGAFLESIGEQSRAYEVRQRALFFLEKNLIAAAATPGAALAQHQAALQEQYAAIAVHEERSGKIDEARELLAKATAILPAVPTTTGAVSPAAAAAAAESATPFLDALLASISFERRQFLAANPSAESAVPFDSAMVHLYQRGLSVLDPTASAAALPFTKAYAYLSLHFASFLQTQVEFAEHAQRVNAVRAVFARSIDLLFPQPVAASEATAPAPAAAAADGAAPPAVAPVAVTSAPRLTPSKQFLLLIEAYVAFESQVARAPLAALTAIYERVLRFKPAVSAGAPVPAAATAVVGASGLSDAARRQLWTAYVALIEDRAASLDEMDRVRKAAKSAMSTLPVTGVSTAAQLSVLGKRKHTVSPTPKPVALAPIKRAMPPARPYGGYAHGGGYGHGHQQQGGYGGAAHYGGGGGGGGYGHHAGGYGGPAAAGGGGADYAAYYAQYGQYPQQHHQ